MNQRALHLRAARRAHVVPAYVTTFVNAHAAKAQEISRRTHIPASVLLAQACEESGFGRWAPGNAFFGLKGRSPGGRTTVQATHEVVAGRVVAEKAAFRAYKDFDEAADDYADYLVSPKTRFGRAFAHVDDPIAFARALGDCGYATNPKYAANLVSIIRVHGLLRFEVNRRDASPRAPTGAAR